MLHLPREVVNAFRSAPVQPVKKGCRQRTATLFISKVDQARDKMRKIEEQQQRLAARKAKKEAEIAAMQQGAAPVNVVRMDAATHAQFLAFQQHM